MTTNEKQLEQLILLYDLKKQYCEYCYKRFAEADSTVIDWWNAAQNYMRARAEEKTVIEICDILGIDIKKLWEESKK